MKRDPLIRRDKVFAVLPTALTLGNGICGFGAITFASRWANYDTPTSLFVASCLIYLGMVLDAFDGRTARWVNQQSEFGAQLDSLCDAITFGAAPAFLMIQFSVTYGYHPRLLWMVGALYVVCTVLRLARFNVESDDGGKHPKDFTGLPSPAAAAVVAAFPMMAFGPTVLADPAYDNMWGPEIGSALDWVAARVLPIVTFVAAGLMVSRIRYHRHLLARGRGDGPAIIRLVFIVMMIAAIPRVAAPLLSCWYAFATPAQLLWERYPRRWFARPALSSVPGDEGREAG
ncbi:CDP-diacylglycerol--serine O-phosphatidyltransferase [Limnoglobus roseus]|uniref:CDP-diacylglycerol--serine O-phosphatidyltransferase n=1 Tax=Limnoglobus roseus TaxID=2598579 RepID=A0A5C1AI93_9BACT|nr:CDP-diacylglycerol--serine O-phosphatidyltransferase [Limnoglobus roseus]QEL18560.1 CDP-diacylglycerol--serine O-phosphatidyltransferase [Limnoglobus roseus]